MQFNFSLSIYLQQLLNNLSFSNNIESVPNVSMFNQNKWENYLHNEDNLSLSITPQVNKLKMYVLNKNIIFNL